MGREFIDGLGEHLRQDRSDLFPSKPGALRERIDHIWSKRISNITGSGRLVGPVPIQDLAMSPNAASCNCLRRPPRPPTTLPGEISSAPPGQVGTLSASGALRLPLIYLEASSAIISDSLRCRQELRNQSRRRKCCLAHRDLPFSASCRTSFAPPQVSYKLAP